MSSSRRRPARPAPLDPPETTLRPAVADLPAGERPPAASRGSFGPWLRAQREARGVTLAEIAESSKISVRYLEALENDRFEVLPAPVFVRGFLREYARVAGLDADEVVNLYLVAAPRAPAERRPEPSGSRSSYPGPGSSGGSSLGRGLLAGFFVLLVLGAAAGLAYWAARRSGAVAPGPQVPAAATPAAPEPQPSAVEPAPAPPVAESPAQSTNVVPPVAKPDPAPPAAEAAPLALAPGPATPVAAAAGAPGPMIVVLAFQQDCWVETRVDGGRRASELKAGGETLTLEAKESIVLTLGNAPAVRAELNGRPLALPADATRLLREFRIDRSLLAPPGASEPPQPSQP